jgi:hypothetical protein
MTKGTVFTDTAHESGLLFANSSRQYSPAAYDLNQYLE